MSTATLTSKGQVTVPVGVRQAMKLDTGDRVEFIEVAPGRYEFVAATLPVTALKGIFGTGTATKPVSVEQMNAAIANRASSAANSAK